MSLLLSLGSTALSAALVLAPASSSDERLISAPVTSYTIEVPAPGETVTHPVVTTNVSGRPVELSLRMPAATGPLWSGDAPLRATILDDRGRTLLTFTGEASDTVSLGTLGSDASARLRLSVTLPAAAGNEYQGLSTAVTTQFVGVAADPTTTRPATPTTSAPQLESESRDELALTGGDDTAMWGGVALIALGGAMLACRLRTRVEESR